jgi:aspartyl-tRNA(Asn)/glutamyl-tRNA(Gln) amidotransferase subunit C
VSDTNDFKVDYVANLARLDITPEEAKRYQGQLDGILSYIEELTSIDVDGIEPTAHPAPVLDRLREDDAPAFSIKQEAFLRNAPDQASNQLRVPKVVDPS